MATQISRHEYITILPTTVDDSKQQCNHQYAEINIPPTASHIECSNSIDDTGYNMIDPAQPELPSLNRRRMSLESQYYHTTTDGTMHSGIDIHRSRRMSLGPQFYHRSEASSSLKSQYPIISRDIYSSSDSDAHNSIGACYHSSDASIIAVSPRTQYRSRSETYTGLFRQALSPYCYYKPTNSDSGAAGAGTDTEILLKTLRVCGVSFSRPDSPE